MVDGMNVYLCAGMRLLWPNKIRIFPKLLNQKMYFIFRILWWPIIFTLKMVVSSSVNYCVIKVQFESFSYTIYHMENNYVFVYSKWTFITMKIQFVMSLLNSRFNICFVYNACLAWRAPGGALWRSNSSLFRNLYTFWLNQDSSEHFAHLEFHLLRTKLAAGRTVAQFESSFPYLQQIQMHPRFSQQPSLPRKYSSTFPIVWCSQTSSFHCMKWGFREIHFCSLLPWQSRTLIG